ncbi:MAG: SDR family NAD(P)-dependent oxidoreductase [Alphaproteobacteria bacterium]
MSKASQGFDLNGHRILITGAGAGIGRATAHLCAGLGASLVLADLRAPDRVADELGAKGASAEAFACDVSDRAAVDALVARAGAVDGAVAAAGVLLEEHWEDERWDAEFDLTMGVNVRGSFHLARALLPGMRQRGGGRIVLFGSGAGKVGSPLPVPAYSASKASVFALTKWLARRETRNNIMVNCIIPGPTDTGMIAGKAPVDPKSLPLGRLATADDIAGPVAFLLTPAARYVAGALIDVNAAGSLG